MAVTQLQVCLLFYHVLGVVLRREQYHTVTTVGYSAVIFGCVPVQYSRTLHHEFLVQFTPPYSFATMFNYDMSVC